MVKRSHDQLKVEEVLMKFVVASEQADALLANKSQARREIERSFRVRMSFSSFIDTHTDRVMSLTGSPEHIASTFGSLARTWTGKKVGKEFTIRMIIPGPMVVKIVGYKGTTLRRLHRQSGAKLNVSKKAFFSSSNRLFTATGVPDSLHRVVYFTSLIYLECTSLLKKIEKVPSPNEPHNNSNPLRRRINGTFTPPESPTDFVSRKKKTTDKKHTVTAKNPTSLPSLNRIDFSQTLEDEFSVCVVEEEDLFQELSEAMPCSPPPETEYKLASKRYEPSPPPSPPSPLLLDTPVEFHNKEEEIVTCPPSPPLSVDDETVTKRLMVTCPMVGTVLSISEELLNLMRQNSGAAIRVKEIVNDEQVQLVITGSKTQVSRVMDDLTLTTRNSYLFTKALEQSEEYVEEETASSS